MLGKELLQCINLAVTHPDHNYVPVVRIHWDLSLALKVTVVVEAEIENTNIQLPNTIINNLNSIKPYIKETTYEQMVSDNLPIEQYLFGSNTIYQPQSNILYCGSLVPAVLLNKPVPYKHTFHITFNDLNDNPIVIDDFNFSRKGGLNVQGSFPNKEENSFWFSVTPLSTEKLGYGIYDIEFVLLPSA